MVRSVKPRHPLVRTVSAMAIGVRVCRASSIRHKRVGIHPIYGVPKQMNVLPWLFRQSFS